MTPDAFTSAAESLYGAPAAPVAAAPTAATPDTQTPEAPQVAAVDLKVTVPPEVAALRAAEETGLYSRTSGLDSVPFEAVLSGTGLPSEVQAVVATEYRHMAADIGASSDEASQILATVQGMVSTPPTPEQSARMQGEAAALVVAKYGDEATQVLDITKKMIARDPRLAQVLNASGAGNDPRTVMTLVELAVRQRAAGHLK